MGKFDGVLFTSDFDQTISDLTGAVPQANLQALDYFVSEGGRFCLNTGRSIPMARRRALQLPCNAPCLLYNGAACYDYAQQRTVFAHSLPDFAKELPALLSDEVLCMEVQGLLHHYAAAPIQARAEAVQAEGIRWLPLEEMNEPWMKLVFCSTEGNIFEHYNSLSPAERERWARLRDRIVELCAGRCYVTASLPRVIEISNPNCNKGVSARALAKILDCKHLVCAGDAMNDAQMLAMADFAFCPTDAQPGILSLPNIRPTTPSSQGAVAAAIEQLERLLSSKPTL